MDAKELSAFLAPPKPTALEILLVITALAIDLALIVAGARFYARDYRQGILFSVLAVAMALLFFRKRKFALAWSSLSWVFAFVTSIILFRPRILPSLILFRIALALGSGAGLYFTARLQYKRFPYLSYKSRRAVFEGEAAMEAENTRIEASARELVKSRPFGPWLFR